MSETPFLERVMLELPELILVSKRADERPTHTAILVVLGAVYVYPFVASSDADARVRYNHLIEVFDANAERSILCRY
jgi:hypothetical protein